MRYFYYFSNCTRSYKVQHMASHGVKDRQSSLTPLPCSVTQEMSADKISLPSEFVKAPFSPTVMWVGPSSLRLRRFQYKCVFLLALLNRIADCSVQLDTLYLLYETIFGIILLQFSSHAKHVVCTYKFIDLWFGVAYWKLTCQKYSSTLFSLTVRLKG